MSVIKEAAHNCTFSTFAGICYAAPANIKG